MLIQTFFNIRFDLTIKSLVLSQKINFITSQFLISTANYHFFKLSVVYLKIVTSL